jgi:hypothetical protein
LRANLDGRQVKSFRMATIWARIPFVSTSPYVVARRTVRREKSGRGDGAPGGSARCADVAI